MTPLSRSVVICLLAALGLPGCGQRSTEPLSFPARPIKVIVPFAAGGGSDSFARVIQSAIEEQGLLKEKLVIINLPGAGGTIGSRRVKNARPDGYTILLLHEGILTAKYSGQAAYGPEAFQPIAGSGDAEQVICVTENSPYADLSALMQAVSARPDEVVYAANIGAPSYYAGLMLEQQAAGSAFRYVQSGGGAKRFAALQGGHVDVTSFSLAEFMQYRGAGIRAIALLGEARHASLPAVATAREQGFDVISKNMQFWWAPRNTPSVRVDAIAAAIEQAIDSEAVQDQLAAMKIEPILVQGPALLAEINSREQRIAQVSSPTPVNLPNYPQLTLAVLAILGCLIGVNKYYHRAVVNQTGQADSAVGRPQMGIAGIVLALTSLYILSLQCLSTEFRLTTILYVVSVGLIVASQTEHFSGKQTITRGLVIRLAMVAIIMTTLTHYIFTEVLVVDLP